MTLQHLCEVGLHLAGSLDLAPSSVRPRSPLPSHQPPLRYSILVCLWPPMRAGHTAVSGKSTRFPWRAPKGSDSGADDCELDPCKHVPGASRRRRNRGRLAPIPESGAEGLREAPEANVLPTRVHFTPRATKSGEAPAAKPVPRSCAKAKAHNSDHNKTRTTLGQATQPDPPATSYTESRLAGWVGTTRRTPEKAAPRS